VAVVASLAAVLASAAVVEFFDVGRLARAVLLSFTVGTAITSSAGYLRRRRDNS